MNEQVLDTLANVAITLAAFSGLVVAFRVRGVHVWSPTELRVLGVDHDVPSIRPVGDDQSVIVEVPID